MFYTELLFFFFMFNYFYDEEWMNIYVSVDSFHIQGQQKPHQLNHTAQKEQGYLSHFSLFYLKK